MPKVKLTTKAVENAKAQPGDRLELFDATLPGFGLRVGATNKTWFVFYRIGGKQKRLNLGHFPALSLSDARIAAGKALEAVDAGDDPAIQRDDAAKAAASAQQYKAETGYAPGSFGDIAARYIKQECGLLRRGKEVEQIIDRELQPHWKDRPADALRRRDLSALLDPIILEGKIQKAHKVRELAIRVVNWAVDRGDLDANMLASASRGRKRSGILRREKRDRVLSMEELRDIWLACDEMTGPLPSIVKLLMTTGQRRDEVGAMRRAELDLEAGVWTIPSDRYKTGVVHVVPLTDLAKEVINGAAAVSDEFVFATRKDTHFSGYGKCKQRLDAKIAERRQKDNRPAMAPWTLHDLRRTLRTGLAEMKVDADTAERVLGHVIGGVEGVYNRHAYLEEKRHALQVWEDRIRRMLDHDPGGNVIQMAAQR